ncbi:MAG TPA: hypothetical protein VLE46_10350 [Nitrospira sp.]|nr:hypothetical protein [Nitrospira sp.]
MSCCFRLAHQPAAAANIMIGYLNYRAAINNNVLAITNRSDGEIAARDTTVGAGGNFGLLYQPRTHTRIGVTYYSQVSLNFGAVPAFTGLRMSGRTVRHGETNVSPDYKQSDNAFTGKIVKVTVAQK